jgi:hypothetical protein
MSVDNTLKSKRFLRSNKYHVVSGNSTVNPINDLGSCYLQRYADVINVKSDLIQLSFDFSYNTRSSVWATLMAT